MAHYTTAQLEPVPRKRPTVSANMVCRDDMTLTLSSPGWWVDSLLQPALRRRVLMT